MFDTEDVVTERKYDIINTLYAAGYLSGFLAIYRLGTTLLDFSQMLRSDIYNSVIYAVALASISLWCIRYAIYRDKEKYEIKDFVIMKTVCLIAAICCVLRVISAIIYFVLLMLNAGIIYYIYAGCNILLWSVFAVFFFLSWKDKNNKDNMMRAMQREREAI